MEKLNEYLQTLLSTCSYELHLEPNKIPCVVSDSGTTEVANAPLLGTQISMLVFPLIPPAVKQELPNKSEVEFVHKHALGSFNFSVRKSPAGFIVTVRPLLSDAAEQSLHSSVAPENFLPISINNSISDAINAPQKFENSFAAPPISTFPNQANREDSFRDLNAQSLSFENMSAPVAVENQTNYKTQNAPEIETVPFHDAQFSTGFSDDSTCEPPLRPQEFASPTAAAYSIAPPQIESPLENSAQNFQSNQFAETHQTHQPAQMMPPISPPSPVAVNINALAFSDASANPQMRQRMDALFHRMAEVGASDLHVSATMPPLVRRDGRMERLECDEQTLAPEMTRELLTAIMPAKNQEEFAQRRDTDFAYEIENLARFRANIFMDRKGMGGVFRIIPSKILTAEQLGLSPAIMNLCDLSKGLVVVTGPTGSGKSTTLCAMVDAINKKREDHIITIEDPIEFTHENQKCLVNQREVHNHTDSFKDALRAALREDPDILLVGEMRDLETISIAIETAETGHLVFGTLHTTTAASTVDRIIDQFPADRQQQIRVMLSESLKGVIAQTLLPKKGGGRVAALEVLIVTPAISNLIREGKTFQIPSAMQTGKVHGMVMLNDALFELVKKGLVEPRDAYIKAVDKTNFEALLTRNGMKI